MIAHEMMLLEQLKGQMEQMKAGMKPNEINKDGTPGNFSLEKASKSVPNIPRGKQAISKNEDM